MRASVRGRLHTLVEDDGGPVRIELQDAIVTGMSHKGGKTYVTLLCSDTKVLEVDRHVRSLRDIESSPVLGDKFLVVKIGATTLWDRDLQVGQRVNVAATLGNFGSFGYCWVARSVVRPYRQPGT